MRTVVAVYDYPDAVKAFVSAGLWGRLRDFGECTSIGYANAEEGLVAGFVFHNYEPEYGSIELSGFSTRRDWATRDVVANIFGGYPFKQLGCRLLIGRHSEHNTRVRRIWKALGAEEVLIPQLRSDDESEAVAILKRDVFLKSRFMRGRNG
ncbi:MAG: N-acetyltransferase [Roseibium sp.]|nr:N-acetyltransferase [Roseibium sp.]